MNLKKDIKTIVREHVVSKATFYKWRQRYGGMKAGELKKIKALHGNKGQTDHLIPV